MDSYRTLTAAQDYDLNALAAAGWEVVAASWNAERGGWNALMRLRVPHG